MTNPHALQKLAEICALIAKEARSAARIFTVMLASLLLCNCMPTKGPLPLATFGSQQPATSSQRGGGVPAGTNGGGGSAPSAAANPVSGGTPGAVVANKRAAYAPVPTGYSLDMVDSWVSAFTAANSGSYKFIYISPDNASDAELNNILRVAAAKAWNHLSRQALLDIPTDISNGAGLAFALNPRTIWGDDADANWAFLANCTRKANIQISPAPVGDCDGFDPTQPVELAQFVYNATNGGPYANIHATPHNFRSFRSVYALGPVTYTSTAHNAIVCGPRIIAYRPVTIAGASSWYAFTTDEFDGRDGGDINYTQAPTDGDQRSTGAFNAGPGDSGTAVASEWWMQLPNGFMYWGIHGEGGQERGKAEYPFAIDPANWSQNSTLATGRSCMTCHASGIQSSPSDTAYAGQNGWTSNSDLDAFYAGIRGKFTAAMQTLVTQLSDGDDELNTHLANGLVEPIAKALRQIEGPAQRAYSCNSFCNGKFSSSRANFCSTMPQQ